MARRAPPCDGVRPRHRPVVAATDRVVVARRSEADRRTEEGESAGLGRRDGPGHGHFRLRPTQVDDLRPRDGGHRDGVALDRCVPLGADGGEEPGERRRECLPHQAEHGLLPRLPALEVAVHGEGAQERVLVAPLHGLRPQGQVLEGRGPEGGEARVRPRRVGGEHVPLVRPQRLHGPPGDEAKPEDTRLAVHLERGAPDERRELAGRAAPQEVHLEEALLRVQEAGGARHVEAAAAAHDRHPERVALDPHRRAEAGHRALAFHLREARAQPRVEVRAAAARGEGDGGDGATQDQRPAPAPVIPRDFGPAGSRGIRRDCGSLVAGRGRCSSG